MAAAATGRMPDCPLRIEMMLQHVGLVRRAPEAEQVVAARQIQVRFPGPLPRVLVNLEHLVGPAEQRRRPRKRLAQLISMHPLDDMPVIHDAPRRNDDVAQAHMPVRIPGTRNSGRDPRHHDRVDGREGGYQAPARVGGGVGSDIGGEREDHRVRKPRVQAGERPQHVIGAVPVYPCVDGIHEESPHRIELLGQRGHQAESRSDGTTGWPGLRETIWVDLALPPRESV
jgi:hypothetical protein